MERKVFYSWQSDLPNKDNRNFMEKSLKNAVKDIATDDKIDVIPVIDRDTYGVSGSPDISKTIFEKILNSDVFVADVSIINRSSKLRKSPNPNVLIELGYAMKALGPENVVLVMNTKHGKPELLPFDLKMRRILTYDNSHNPKEVQKSLTANFKSQFTTIFSDPDKNSAVSSNLISNIESQSPMRIVDIKKYMNNLYQHFDNLYPGDGMIDAHNADPEYDEKIVQAIKNTANVLPDYRNLVETISLYDDEKSIKTLFAGFKPILERFNHEKGFSGGTSHKAKFDFFKFLANELFVILVSILLREEKWHLISIVLSDTIILNNFSGYKTEAVDYKFFSPHFYCFELRKQRLKSNRTSIHYDTLIERRENEAQTFPDAVDEYTSADLFLFLKGESGVINSTDICWDWTPRSLLKFNTPIFIFRAQDKKIADSMSKALGLKSVQDLQILLKNKVPNLKRDYSGMLWDNPVSDEHIESIGSR